MPDPVNWSLSSLLILVSDLDRSLEFYMDVCDLQKILHEDNAALLGGDGAGSFTLALREVERGSVHSGRGALGSRACGFYVGSATDLDRVEGRLKARSAFQDRQQRDDKGRIDIVRGHDPDRLPLAFVGSERLLTGLDHRSVFSLMYGWDV